MSSFLSGKRVVVTGGAGFLGSRVVETLKKKNVKEIIIPRSKKYDLRDKDACKKIVKNADVIIHLAAKVGGIGLNLAKPAELFYDNLIMGIQLMEEARLANVEKFVVVGTICSYPKFTPVPFKEDDLWNGYPEETNAPYGLAKKMLLVQSQAYRKQYNFNSIFLLMVNLFGPNDNFDMSSSHVIPALIRKIAEAKQNNLDSIKVWGDGSPSREFLYVDDAARGIVLAAEKYNQSEPVNLGTGREITIFNLVKLISKIMKYNGRIIWEKDKPNGQPRRCLDVTRAYKEFGFKSKISLEQGLKNTINWYLKNCK